MKKFNELFTKITNEVSLTREPYYGGVFYINSVTSELMLEIAYPTSLLESQAIEIINKEGFEGARNGGIFVYVPALTGTATMDDNRFKYLF